MPVTLISRGAWTSRPADVQGCARPISWRGCVGSTRSTTTCRATLGHALTTDPEAANNLVGDLMLAWWFRGRTQEIRDWAEAALAASAGQPSAARAKALAMAGNLAEPSIRPGAAAPTDLRHELKIAETHQREALAFDDEHGYDDEAASVCLLLHNTLTRQASMGEPVDLDEAAAVFERARNSFDRRGDDYGSSMTRINAALLAIATRRPRCRQGPCRSSRADHPPVRGALLGESRGVRVRRAR